MKRKGKYTSHAFHINGLTRAGFRHLNLRLKRHTGGSEEENWGRNDH
uniref:Uncharacterized protein n=1 Tax=Triticum urartu TaxID=4572 RepID=A0A8R7QAN4_TRIUA